MQQLEYCKSLERQVDEKDSQLMELQKSLQKSKKEFQLFAEAVSHDLRSPLRAISGFSDFLQQEYQSQLDETATGYLDRIVDGVGRMDGLLTGLTQFSRVTTKAAPFELVDLNEILAEAELTLQEFIESVGAVVRVDELPKITGDRAQLSLLFKHLIANALKFNNSKIPTVHVRAERAAGQWVVTVSDNGIGIPQEHLDCVFVIFRRLHVREEYQGIGAGLAVCRQIVDRHGGQIWLDSEEGIGTQAAVKFHESVSA